MISTTLLSSLCVSSLFLGADAAVAQIRNSQHSSPKGGSNQASNKPTTNFETGGVGFGSGSGGNPFTQNAHHHASSSYTFNPNATDNVAVYYGSTNATASTNVSTLCNQTAIDMVVLTFISEINGAGGYPNVAFNNYCSGQTSEMVAANATGLLWCPEIASEISYCQSIGKKVLVSIGGASGNVTFANSTDATQSAELLWNIFGAGTASNISYRPFGNAVVDGFDIDNESGKSNEWTTFVSALRSIFDAYTQKTFYLSAAPQCYYPSPSAPLDMLTMVDFVWPQFYDSATCGVGTSGFNNSVSQWSKRLATGNDPKLLIGAIDFNDGGAGGYVDPDSFYEVVKEIRKMKLSNLGGVTLWDGPYGLEDTDAAGVDYVNVTKAALESSVRSDLKSHRH